VVSAIRERIAPWDEDRYLHTDLNVMKDLLPTLAAL
jgi:hypothetical protein